MNIFTVLSAAAPMVKMVMLLLLFMSLSSWALMIYKFFLLREAQRKATICLDRFTEARDMHEAVQMLGMTPNAPVYHIAQLGVAEFGRLKESGNSAEVVSNNVRRSLRQGVSEVMADLSSRLSFLATCSNTAPFIGLFGTVWGIMSSFHSIGLAGKASLATVAPGISEALITTAIGLFVAIPATIGYNTLLTRMNRIESELINFAGVFLNRVEREVNAANLRANQPR